MVMYVAGQSAANHDGSGYNVSERSTILVEASLSGSIGSYRLVRTATTDVCVCGVLSGDVCLFVHSFLSLHFFCSAFNTRYGARLFV